MSKSSSPSTKHISNWLIQFTLEVAFTPMQVVSFISFCFISRRKRKDEKVAATLAKIYRSDGLAWSANYVLEFSPSEVSFKPETGELTLRGESQQSIVDKNGKLK